MADWNADTERLLSEGLDLCVRARKIDAALNEQAVRDRFPESAALYPETYSRSGTPHLWVQEQYDTDLADWERRARSHLLNPPAPSHPVPER